jgi:chemotaxis response regulator CheB
VAPTKSQPAEQQENPPTLSPITPLSTAATDKVSKKPAETTAAAPTASVDLNVWVLGASLGGPQAVRQFLSAIQEDLPVVFILAQHIGANHVSLLAEQLNRVTAFTVLPGKTGHQLKHGEVILTPADKQLAITDDGFLALSQAPPATIYSPSIDNVMTEVARRYGDKGGTIVFSGMGDDGARGCESIAEHGGVVWAQDIASCVVSSMPDQARKTGKVTYSATPEQLAKHLYEYYQK